MLRNIVMMSFASVRLKFEVESCDTLDIDFEEGELSDKEKSDNS